MGWRNETCKIRCGVEMSFERLSRMFAGAVDCARVPGHGGPIELSRSEVAGFMAGSSPEEMDLVYAFFGDAKSFAEFVSWLEVAAWRIACNESWSLADRQLIPPACLIAAGEVLDSRCPRCMGTGYARARLCGGCGGVGNARLSGRVVSRTLGVEHTRYVRVWRYRYDMIYVIAQDVLCRASNRVKSAVRRGSVLIA